MIGDHGPTADHGASGERNGHDTIRSQDSQTALVRCSVKSGIQINLLRFMKLPSSFASSTLCFCLEQDYVTTLKISLCKVDDLLDPHN